MTGDSMNDDCQIDEDTQIQLEEILRNVNEVTDHLPDPLNLNKSVNELEKTIETAPRLKSQEK